MRLVLAYSSTLRGEDCLASLVEVRSCLGRIVHSSQKAASNASIGATAGQVTEQPEISVFLGEFLPPLGGISLFEKNSPPFQKFPLSLQNQSLFNIQLKNNAGSARNLTEICQKTVNKKFGKLSKNCQKYQK